MPSTFIKLNHHRHLCTFHSVFSGGTEAEISFLLTNCKFSGAQS